MHKLTDADRKAILNNPNVRVTTQAEFSAHTLRGLISYHERMTMGECPEKDAWRDALLFALSCVEEKAGTTQSDRQKDLGIQKKYVLICFCSALAGAIIGRLILCTVLS